MTSEQNSALSIQVIEQVLNFIRGNLYNIEKSWGKDSEQFRSAAKLMDEWLDENVKQLKLEKPDIDELMAKMSLDESKG